MTNENLGREAHWFDGDGMLSGVLFRRTGEDAKEIRPEFVNQYLVTDVYRYAECSTWLRKPLLPSIATLTSPFSGLFGMLQSVTRTAMLVALSRLNGRHTVERISVANTSVLYHDGRGLATCESGPPLRFALPGLETIGWFNGRRAENEQAKDLRAGFGGEGALAFMREWTTAHPKVDPVSRELIAFHSTFTRPYVRCSIVKPSKPIDPGSSTFDEPVAGITSPKMMHDFGVSRQHTIIMDLPLTMTPMNQVRGLPGLHYDSTKTARFGVFRRYDPSRVVWFETNPCLIFHSANCWDTWQPVDKGLPTEMSVHLLACRHTSASNMFVAGNLPIPEPQAVPPGYAEEEQCRLYYYNFSLSDKSGWPSHIKHQWALSAIPFEFPTTAPEYQMQEARYVYGCTASTSFTVALGKAAKVDYLAKIDVKTLIARGKTNPPQPIKGCVDTRTLGQIVSSGDPDDAIKLFQMPRGWFAQEARFVPRRQAQTEDDGWLLTYVFDETQLEEGGACRDGACSELWVIDAKEMKDVVARIRLPQRVPYGLHGNWFSEQDIQSQKPFEAIRGVEIPDWSPSRWTRAGDVLERWLG